MDLLDTHLPHFQFREQHSIDIRATAARIMAAVQAYDSRDDALVRAMTAIREMPQRLLNRFDDAANVSPPFSLDNFTPVASIPGQALALGLAGRFWKLDYGQQPLEDAQAFERFAEPGAAKLLLGFATMELGAGMTRLVTETRVHCLDAQALRQFRPYWYLIRPASGLIRKRVLKAIKRQVLAEQRESADIEP